MLWQCCTTYKQDAEQGREGKEVGNNRANNIDAWRRLQNIRHNSFNKVTGHASTA
jgi:hypothetical protein